MKVPKTKEKKNIKYDTIQQRWGYRLLTKWMNKSMESSIVEAIGNKIEEYCHKCYGYMDRMENARLQCRPAGRRDSDRPRFYWCQSFNTDVPIIALIYFQTIFKNFIKMYKSLFTNFINFKISTLYGWHILFPIWFPVASILGWAEAWRLLEVMRLSSAGARSYL